MFIIIEYNPHNKGDGADRVIGPFPTQQDADTACAIILAEGGHPDSDWEILPLTNIGDVLDELRLSNEEVPSSQADTKR